jgi:hypothetical protein
MKKKLSLFIFALVFVATAFAHYTPLKPFVLHHWVLTDRTEIDASFLMYKKGLVYIETGNNTVLSFPYTGLSNADQQYVGKRYQEILQINKPILTSSIDNSLAIERLLIVALLLLIITTFIYFYLGKRAMRFAYYFCSIGVLASLYSFTQKSLFKTTSGTNPIVIDSAFTPFKPNVITSWDTTYFYVQSQGIPTTHGMMVGISSNGWQQQVPIPQCYLLPNAWSIPLHPVITSVHIPVDTIHFTRGAIAIAANGVPIFNEHTNTGADALVAGQLDDFGGHCGRADDYHYHVAPLHLYGHTASNLPIAYAFDGFAVFGTLEPDGAAMAALDSNHGHIGSNGVYHYHGTSTYPYMIAKFAGQVTEDTTHQLVPQAAAHPVRPGQNPLAGALITSCVANGNNGYTLTYTLNGQTYQVAYSWTAAGVYTFNFINPGGTTTQTYNGFIPCSMPTGISNITLHDVDVEVYPNPTHQNFSLRLSHTIAPRDVKAVWVVNSLGSVVRSFNSYYDSYDMQTLSKGLYFVQVKLLDKLIVKKLMID